MIYLLPQTIFAAAERTPDKEAFVCGRDRLTYAETAARVRQLAATLWRLGVRRGDRVGVYLNRSIETVIALHGIMHTGAAYVPLDPKAPAERTCFQLADGGITVIVTNKAQRNNLARTQVQAKDLKHIVGLPEPLNETPTTSWAEVFTAPSHFTPPINQVEYDLAYIMYTSGSTGRPKGMMHTHASGLAFAHLAVANHGLTANDRFGNHAPIYFDISTLGYFAAPLIGASTVIATDGHTIFPASMGGLLATEQISVWYSVPLALTQMLQSQALPKQDLSRLRHVFYAGEPFAPKYIREWRAAVPHAKLTNWYGPAETNVCTYYNITTDPVGDQHVPIGRVWANTEALVFEPGMETEADRGELLIRSATTMAGYWNRPDLTARAFYDRPTASGILHRFYRTGDLVQRNAAGDFEFLGRADNQVKVRGYRVELDAIEARLLAHPDVAEAVVITLPGAEETLQLNAVVILRPGASLTAKELTTFAGEQLTWYAIPEVVHFTDQLPRTGSGKVSRPALREQLTA